MSTMSQTLPLHLALLLVPYLAPADIARAQLVCKDWAAVFTADTLLLATLRTHFPFSHEVRTRSTTTTTAAAAFTRVARRYKALRAGTPQQELRIPITKTRRDTYNWTFSENTLIYQSSHHPHAVLTFLRLDFSTTPRRLRTGTLTLAVRGQTVIRVRLRCGILVVERCDDRDISASRTVYAASAACYLLTPTGSSGLSAAPISVIHTFQFEHIDYSHQILSDHTGTYYAAYSKSGGDSGVGVWEIATGRKVKRIAPARLEGLGGMMTDLLLVREPTGHKVIMIGNDKRNNNSRRWDRFPTHWGYRSNVHIFPVEGAEGEGEARGFVGRTKADCPQGSNLLSLSFKLDRIPGDPDTLDEAALVLWELEDGTDKATAHYHVLSTAALAAAAPGQDEALRADTEYVVSGVDSMLRNIETGQRPAPFTVHTKDALSFSMEFTGRNDEFEDTRLMVYNIRIQMFYPSRGGDADVRVLAWDSCLKEAQTSLQPVGEETGTPNNVKPDRKKRGIYSANRNVVYMHNTWDGVVGDERAIVFLELGGRGMDLVVAIWDYPFEGEVPGNGKSDFGLSEDVFFGTWGGFAFWAV